MCLHQHDPNNPTPVQDCIKIKMPSQSKFAGKRSSVQPMQSLESYRRPLHAICNAIISLCCVTVALQTAVQQLWPYVPARSLPKPEVCA